MNVILWNVRNDKQDKILYQRNIKYNVGRAKARRTETIYLEMKSKQTL
jgi:hypothetical protein